MSRTDIPSGERRPIKTCPVCNSARIYYLFSTADCRVVRCDDCGLVFLNPQPSEAELARIYGADYFLGGAVLYTRGAWRTLKDYRTEAFAGTRPATEANALIRARLLRESYGAGWCVAESGAAGPKGNSYGDIAGHSCIAVAGTVERARTLETGSTDRVANMYAFAAAALELLAECMA